MCIGVLYTVVWCIRYIFFFFKQKTAYEMRISDWSSDVCSSDLYFRGLNYLLNEQPDKAIELFLHIPELDKDTFETQVALGHLFRWRGDVARAIRLHQGLVQRPDLSDPQKVQALLALGPDSTRSGLLDRADTVFTDPAKTHTPAPHAANTEK